MGWTYVNNATRADIIAECVADQPLAEGGVLRTVRKAHRGNTMYSVLECTRAGKTTKLIGVTLLGRSKSGWGYKSMDEREGPHYYNCPLSFLDEVGEPQNETAKTWREIVRSEAERLAVIPQVGETWELREGFNLKQVEITSIKPLRGSAAGTIYSLNRRILARRVPTSEAP
jgi:hypothetical protein